MHHYKTLYASPVGDLLLTSDNKAITGILFIDTKQEKAEAVSDVSFLPEVMQVCIQQLDKYFAGTLRTFNISIKQQGTLFQQSVWKALCEIPYGHTWSYLALAKHIGNKKKVSEQ